MKIVVLGGGESGFGAAYLAKKKGFDVFLSDRAVIKNEYKNLLIENNIEFEEENHDEERILSADWIVKSPGIPKKTEIIIKIKQKGIRLSSEIEFASEFTTAKIIAITGSNGKTTTASLIYHILKNDNLNVGLGGNIGTSFAKLVADENHDYYVLEVSSFQLDDIQNFRPTISLLLNLSQDHLDQYNYDYEEYALAKFRIAENQENDNFFIYNKDDAMSAKLLEKLEIKAKKLPFSLKEKVEEGGIFFVVDYAHTPDALENVLDSINEIRSKNERLITVFGCGGDRDTSKRAEMGKIATSKSTLAIITSDNPRTEDPTEIIKQIEAGVLPQNFSKYTSIPDRKEAIKMAIKFAEPRDIVLVAGKGHETYQDINGTKHHFDDKETLLELAVKMGK
jgi:UDP-N-acetylmuramoylalanine-D-glutamate ligase